MRSTSILTPTSKGKRQIHGPSTGWAGGCGVGSRFDAVKTPDPRSGHIAAVLRSIHSSSSPE